MNLFVLLSVRSEVIFERAMVKMMSHAIYKKEGYVKVNYNPESCVIYVLWKNLFDQKIVRDCCERQLTQVQEDAKAIVVDVSKSEGVVLEDTQKWFEQYLFPGYAKAGLRVIITIDSQSPLTRLSAKRWKEVGSNFNFDMVTVKSKEEAAKVIVEYL